MQASLSEAYEARISAGDLQSDAAQQLVIERLDRLAGELAGYSPGNSGSLLGKLFGNAKRRPAPKGVYIHGDVGRGKTMLMDLCYELLETPAKQRDHFLSFMQNVHERIHEVRRHQRSGEIWATRRLRSHREARPRPPWRG